jgi:hypothetical protein
MLDLILIIYVCGMLIYAMLILELYDPFVSSSWEEMDARRATKVRYLMYSPIWFIPATAFFVKSLLDRKRS